MSVLGSAGIKQAMVRGDIYIEPFEEECLQPNSYDISIGQEFWLPKGYRFDDPTVNPALKRESIYLDQVDPANLWEGPGYNTSHILVPARQTILAATLEVIGAYRRYKTQLRSKSTIARCRIEVCASAGFGDVGYVNKWTLEIDNKTGDDIYIPVGFKVGQIAFLEVIGQDKIYSGSYVQQKAWDPYQMLPKFKETSIHPLYRVKKDNG